MLYLPTKFHILSDVNEMHEGSQVVIQLLNQFGIVSSTDMHVIDRFVIAIAEQQQIKTLWDDLKKEVLTIISATTLICFKAMRQCTVVTNADAIMALQYRLYNLCLIQ